VNYAECPSSPDELDLVPDEPADLVRSRAPVATCPEYMGTPREALEAVAAVAPIVSVIFTVTALRRFRPICECTARTMSGAKRWRMRSTSARVTRAFCKVRMKLRRCLWLSAHTVSTFLPLPPLPLEWT